MEESHEVVAGSDGVSVHTGFPNPGLDSRGQKSLALDLNQLLVKRPNSTYLFRIKGHHWANQGVYDGDIAVIDRDLRPRNTDLVICWQNNSFSLERTPYLRPDDEPWGVVTSVIHQFAR